MINPYWLTLCVFSGAVLGGIFFGGLWWTVQKIPTTRHPVALVLLSFILRMAIVLMGFYGLTQGHWQNLAACILGFWLARMLVTRLTALPRALGTNDTPNKGDTHAFKP